MSSMDQLKLECSTKETTEIVEMILKLQSKLVDEAREIHAVRRRTLENEAELRRVEEEIALIQDEKEYAFSSAWSEEKGSKGDRWMVERVKALEKEIKEASTHYETLTKRAKDLLKEKKLSSNFDLPEDCRLRIKRLENDVAELSETRKLVDIAEWAEEELGKYVQDQKEDAILLCQSLERLKREKFGLDEAVQRKEVKLEQCVEELKGLQHTVMIDNKRVWKIVPISKEAPKIEDIADAEE